MWGSQSPWVERKWKWKLCLTLCHTMDCIVHGILQARILEWTDFPFSRGSSQPRDRTQVSCIAGGFFTNWAIREALSLGWRTINERNIMIIEILPKEQGSGPHIGYSNWESCIQGNDPLHHLSLKTSRVHFGRAEGLSETETMLLKGMCKISYALSPSTEAAVWKKSGPNPLADLRETPRDAGSNWGTSRDWDTGISYFGESILPRWPQDRQCHFGIIPLCMVSTKDLAPPQSELAPALSHTPPTARTATLVPGSTHLCLTPAPHPSRPHRQPLGKPTPPSVRPASYCMRHDLLANLAESQPSLPVYPQQSALSQQKDTRSWHGGTPRAYISGDQGSMLLDPIGCVLHETKSRKHIWSN